jgi:TerC family integral membrane protein
MLPFWIIFTAFVVAMLWIDLRLVDRKPHARKMKEAVMSWAVWVAMAVIFAVIVYFWRGSQTALEFVTGYVIEESLSVDNLFIFLLIFSYFKVPAAYQHKTLFWGILGALIMRGIFILGGVGLLNRFHWVIYIFGGFLVYSGIKLAFEGEAKVEPEKNPLLRLMRRWIPITPDYVGANFFVRHGGRRLATPLLAVLVAVETTDLIFAVDSIPAVLAVTRDPFIVYTSNVFAILGLRSMYFALAGAMETFHFLHYGVSAILTFVGLKMLLSNDTFELRGFPLHYNISTPTTLAVIGGILAVSIVASLLVEKKKRGRASA